jgi:hypothetical protein
MREGGDCTLTIDKRLVRQALPYMLVVAVAIAIAVRAESQTNAVDSRVSRVESPCLKYGPRSELCQKSFEKAVATITHPEACAIERKAGTLRAIRELATGLDVTFKEPCAGARLAQERQRGNEREATSERASDGGDGGEAPPEGGSGEAPATGKGADSSPSAPPKSTGPRHHPPSAPPESGGEGGSAPVEQGAPQSSDGSASSEAPAAEQTAPETRHESVLESAGTTVGEVVNGAGHVVEAAGCGLASPLLCTKP